MTEEEKGTHVFVKGFQKGDYSHQDLYNAFKDFGKILSCKVSLDKDHQSKGYGYIQFESQKSASQAIEEVPLHPLTCRCTVKSSMRPQPPNGRSRNMLSRRRSGSLDSSTTSTSRTSLWSTLKTPI